MRAQIAFRHGARDVDRLAQRSGDRARNHYACADRERHRDQADRDQQIALVLVVRRVVVDQLFLTCVRVVGIRVGGANQRGEQRPAFIVHLDDRLVAFVGQREIDDAGGDRAVRGLHPIDLGDETARFLRRVRRRGDHVVEFLQIRLHIFVCAQHIGFLQVQVLRFGHQHEIARGDGPSVDGGSHLHRHVGTRVDTVHEAGETIG